MRVEKGGEGGKRRRGWKKAERVEKGGEGGCCNTATYSTGEGGATMERERGWKEAKGGKAEGVVAVIQ